MPCVVLRITIGLVCALTLAAAPAQGKTFRYADQGDALSMDPYMFNEAVQLSFTATCTRGSPDAARSWKRCLSSPPTGNRPHRRCGASTCAGT